LTVPDCNLQPASPGCGAVRGHALALLALALVLLAGCADPASDPSSSSPAPGTTSGNATGSASGVDCRAHRHATFAVFTPGPDGPRRLNLSAPKDAQGRAHYQLGIAPNMTVAIHLHQSGHEQGSAALGETQMHYESPGRCASIADSLAVIDVTAGEDGLTVAGQHEAAGKGHWASNATARVHLYVRPAGEACAWEEQEMSALGQTVADGMSFLVAFGSPGQAEAAAMQAAVPRPQGHEACG
jgi:hypothetical protein